MYLISLLCSFLNLNEFSFPHGGKGIIGALILISGLFSNGQAQTRDVYRTQYGKITISTIYKDSAIILHSNKLTVLLNYETAEFKLRLNKSTLRTGNDSLDARLDALTNNYLKYDGKLGLDYIQTESHPPRDFEVEGYLNCFPHNHLIRGKGKLVHVFNDQKACVLTMTFHINLKESGLQTNISGLGNELHIEILQTVLKKDDQ